jgi:hypothetical protein
VVVYLQGHDIGSPIRMATSDFRDLLMCTDGLENANWRDVVAERFGPA